MRPVSSAATVSEVFFGQRVRAGERESIREAPLPLDLQGVVVRSAAVLQHVDLAECGIRLRRLEVRVVARGHLVVREQRDLIAQARGDVRHRDCRIERKALLHGHVPLVGPRGIDVPVRRFTHRRLDELLRVCRPGGLPALLRQRTERQRLPRPVRQADDRRGRAVAREAVVVDAVPAAHHEVVDHLGTPRHADAWRQVPIGLEQARRHAHFGGRHPQALRRRGKERGDRLIA